MNSNQYMVLLVAITSMTITDLCAGDLDTTFGPDNNGIVTTSIQRLDWIQSCTVQTDDKIVVIGTSMGFTEQAALARYTSNGLLDTSFNSDGTQQLSVGLKANGMGIDLKDDGNIIICGLTYENQTDLLVASYTTTGELNTSFDMDGLVITSTGSGSSASSLKIQDDGKAVVGGTTIYGVAQFVLARYNSDGSLDTALGTTGIIFTQIGIHAKLNQIALQTDGKIVAVGVARNSLINTFVTIRYNTDGTLDNTFGTNGIVETSIGDYSEANALAIQNDGKIVVTGYTTEFNKNKIAIVRYDTNGNLDTTFNTTGIVTTQYQYNDAAYATIIQDDGKILVGGSSLGNQATQFIIARYSSTGSLDATFGTNGITTTTIGGTDSISQINSLVFQSDGKIVAAGFSNKDFALARYTA